MNYIRSNPRDFFLFLSFHLSEDDCIIYVESNELFQIVNKISIGEKKKKKKTKRTKQIIYTKTIAVFVGVYFMTVVRDFLPEDRMRSSKPSSALPQPSQKTTSNRAPPIVYSCQYFNVYYIALIVLMCKLLVCQHWRVQVSRSTREHHKWVLLL